MPSQEDIENQRNLLITHRATLQLLLSQHAQFGAAYVPQHIWHGLRQTRTEIRKCKDVLRGWSEQVEDLPDDEDTPNTSPTLPKQAKAGLSALFDLMQTPAARSAIAIYRVNFETTSHQIALLSDYKYLHDQFQQLEDRHTILARCCKTLGCDANIWDDLEQNEPEFYDKAAELLAYAGNALLGEETVTWTPGLARAQQDLRVALEMRYEDGLRDALRRIKGIIGRQLSRTNLRLVGLADALQLTTLIGALQQISERLDQVPGADQDRLDDIRRGVTALGNLNQRLNQSVRLHRAFQDFDDELRRVEGVLEQSLDELIDAWPDLAPMIPTICADNAADWAARLSRLGMDVVQVLANREPLKLRRAFGRLRSQVIVDFNHVDHDLRKLCVDLQQIGKPLDSVLRVIA